MLVRSDIPKLLTAGMKTEFMGAFGKATADYTAIASTIKSGKNQETYPWLGTTPKMREWKDERMPKGLSEYNFSIINYDWEASIAVDRNSVEDEQYGQIMIRVRELAVEAKRFYDELAFGLIAQGNSTTGTGYFAGKSISCYDGAEFFKTDHSEGSSGSQSNYGTTALGVSSLQTAITAMRKFKDDQGKPCHISPNLLVIPPDLEFTARELLNSTYYPETTTVRNEADSENVGGATKLATNVLRGIVNLLVSPYLTDTNNWFLVDTSRTVKPIILQMRKTPIFSSLIKGTESSFMRKQLYYGVDWRGFAAFGDWRTAYGAFVSA